MEKAIPGAQIVPYCANLNHLDHFVKIQFYDLNAKLFAQ